MNTPEPKWTARITCEGETELETTGHIGPETALMALIALSIETWKTTGEVMDADFLETAAEVMTGIEYAGQDCYAAQGGGMGKDFWTLSVFVEGTTEDADEDGE